MIELAGKLLPQQVVAIAIVLGALGLIWLTFRDVGLDGVRAGRHARGSKGEERHA